MKVGLFYLHAVCESPLINFWTPEPTFMKLGIPIMAPESCKNGAVWEGQLQLPISFRKILDSYPD
jgi:hypothetical protein